MPKERIASNESKTSYVYASEIEMWKESLEKDKDLPGFYTRYGTDPSKISAIIFTEKKQKPKNRAAKIKIKIRVVPDDATALQIFCNVFRRLAFACSTEARVRQSW